VDLLAACCLVIGSSADVDTSTAVVVGFISPSSGGVFGGQLLTITGTGLSSKQPYSLTSDAVQVRLGRAVQVDGFKTRIESA